LNLTNPKDLYFVAMQLSDQQLRAIRTEQVLQKGKKPYLHPTGTIYSICDNATYCHSQLIKDWLADNSRVQVLYLPSYSPNSLPSPQTKKL